MTAEEVVERTPDIIIGSWCGKKFRPEKVAARPGFDRTRRRAQRRNLRDQIAVDPATGSGSVDRRVGRASTSHRDGFGE